MSEAEKSALKELVSEAVAEQLRAAAGLMTSEQVANYLGVSVRRWQEMYRGNAALWATRIELELGEENIIIVRDNGRGMTPEDLALAVERHATSKLPDGDLLAGGMFTTAGGVLCNRFARWNGTAWSSIGGTNGPVRGLALAPNGDLYAVGSFTTAGGIAELDWFARGPTDHRAAVEAALSLEVNRDQTEG